MNIILDIKNVNESNKVEKLVTAAKALSEQLGLNADIDVPWLEKAKTHKYISKKWVNDHWEYTYPQTNKSEPPLITGVSELSVNEQNYESLAQQEMIKLKEKIKSGLFCQALNNKKVIDIKTSHLRSANSVPRNLKDLMRRIAIMPYIIPVIEKGIKTNERKNPHYKGNYYEISGATPNGKRIAVILAEKDNGYLYISVIGKKMIKKALCQDSRLLPTNCRTNSDLGTGLTLSGGDIIKSLDREDGSFLHRGPIAAVVKMTSPLSNHAFIIPQISAKSIDNLPNIEVFIQNITPENRKTKFAKAIRAVAERLGVPVSVERRGKEKLERTGEVYLYPIQQELSDRWTDYYSSILKQVCNTVIAALDLPRVDVETMRKAIGSDNVLKYSGKIIYSPETGQPLKVKDFDALIEAIQNFLNRNTKDISRQILLDSVAIGKILRRMAKYHTSENIERLKLDDFKYRGKTFDWIREDIKHIKNILGENLTGPELARYQVAQDYVAHLVTRSNQRVRDDIKDAVLQGIINKRSKAQVSQDLFNRLGGLNRDWSRIADTEIVNTSNLAGILQEVNETPNGEKIYFKRYELAGCCEKCAKVNGKIVLWSDTPLSDDKIKDEYADTAIWEGKPQEKGRTVLVTGTLHPRCRGGWVRWGGTKADAMSAKIQGKIDAWDKAVQKAKAEWKEKGIDNPNDQTKGYTERINEIYNGGED
jgi:transposase